MTIPSVKLNNGVDMPILGLGTFLARHGECEQAVKDAIDVGYRHIDTAFVYGNEQEVGNAVRCKIQEGVIKREDMFIVTKMAGQHHEPDKVLTGYKISMSNLGLGPIDLYLMHTPMGHTSVDYIETWKAMEQLQKNGLVRSIGVSNFNSEQLTRLLKIATIKPACNQIECSPNFTQIKLREFCEKNDIAIVAYAPLVQPHFIRAGQQTALTDPKVLVLAKKYGKSSAQIVLRLLVQLKTIPIPKSSNKGRLLENISIFDFELNSAEVNELLTLNINLRMCSFSGNSGHKYFPFNIEF